MTTTLVRFKYGNDFDEARIRQVAQAARSRFEGMPGLRFKAFTVDTANREALNVYVWDAEESARAFFSPETLERVKGLYGVPPILQYSEVVELVENAR